MTRADLQKLLAAAVRKGALTQADAARILSAFDNGTLDPELPREIKAALDDEGLAGKAALLAAVILLARAKAPAGKVWTYSPSTRRYTSPGRVADTTITGGVVTPEQVREVVDQVIDASEAEMTGLGEQLVGRRVSLAKWIGSMEDQIADRHIAAAAAARGGIPNLTGADRDWIRGQIETQFKFLDGFADDILSGKQALDGRFTARVEQYHRAMRGTYEAMRGRIAREGGANLERNILAPADHCELCLSETARGWVEIGTLIPVGSRTCRSNDRCRITYRSGRIARGRPIAA